MMQIENVCFIYNNGKTINIISKQSDNWEHIN